MSVSKLTSRPAILINIEEPSQFSADEVRDLYYSIIENTTASLYIVAPSELSFLNHGRFNVLDLRSDVDLSTEGPLYGLIKAADLLITTNVHLLTIASATTTKTIAIWLDYGSMLSYALPRVEQINVALQMAETRTAPTARFSLNVLDSFNRRDVIRLVLQTVSRMLRPCRYLLHTDSAVDAQLQRFILDLQGHSPTTFRVFSRTEPIYSYNDRHTSLDILFQVIPQRFVKPVIVETGCIRQRDNFKGDGCSTLLFGILVRSIGGYLYSLEVDDLVCEFARGECLEFGERVKIVCGDSVTWLMNQSFPISVLYLDSLDTYAPNTGEHGLAEIQASYHRLADNAIVVYDDTIWNGTEANGKGSLGVPWLLERGWDVLYSGYQTILQRKPIL